MKTHVDGDVIPLTTFSDAELQKFLRTNGLALNAYEAKLIPQKLGRDPTLTELHVFNIQWSEHSSYKSSKEILKLLPTSASTVILGPKEDAGILKFTTWNNEQYGIVISHESHNHPSQVVPYEGAATGVGGNVRDVLCMGAKVIASADPLRFGNPFGKNKNRTRYIANAVVEGIAGYGNPLGIPILAGDIYFNESFDDNCLVNIVTIGLIKEHDIVHSTVPHDGEGYDVLVIGKATDNSGFGGAAFASLILNEEDREINRGAVQVPDPFLKNLLCRATADLFAAAQKAKVIIGFKDCGAGGIMCAASEMGASGGYGIELDLDKVHLSMPLPPFIIACSETQERFVLVCPKSFTPTALKIYNEDWELPAITGGAKAAVIGTVIAEKRFILKHRGSMVCNAPIDEVTKGIKYQRERKKNIRTLEEPSIDEPTDYNELVLDLLRHPNVANRSKVYEHYDTEVQGCAVIRPGEADAGVMAPIPACPAGVALKVDSNPRYARIDPKKGAINAVAECMRNIAAVGAVPIGLTDCLNYGNPEKPEQFNDFVEGVEGLAEAARELKIKGTNDPCPFVSGNVSFYNESSTGKSIDPSAIVACVGVLEDYAKAITMKLKKRGSVLCLVGPRMDELGGSVYYDLRGHLGKNVPIIDYKLERGMLYGIIDCIQQQLLLSCHDISDGGMVTAIAEMILGGRADGDIGATLQLNDEMRTDKLMCSESSGFVFEVEPHQLKSVEKIFSKYSVDVFIIGETGGDMLTIQHNEKEAVGLTIEQMRDAWCSGLQEALE